MALFDLTEDADCIERSPVNTTLSQPNWSGIKDSNSLHLDAYIKKLMMKEIYSSIITNLLTHSCVSKCITIININYYYLINNYTTKMQLISNAKKE